MEGWSIVERAGGGRHLACRALDRAGLIHAFTLRPAAGGPADPLEGLFPGREVVRPRQVHGATVAVPAGGGSATLPPEADAVVVDRPGRAAAVATADCVGAVLAAPGTGCFAVIHAGWRGILAGVLPAAVARLAKASGARPPAMVLATGPSARGCCYQVGPEVEEPFRRLFAGAPGGERIFGRRGGRGTVDPAEAAAAQAREAGIPGAAIHDAGICTMCRPDLCWSYRIQGAGAGRMLAAALSP